MTVEDMSVWELLLQGLRDQGWLIVSHDRQSGTVQIQTQPCRH